MSFVSDDVIRRLGQLGRDEADELPFGAVRVDDEGRIELYNKWESELAGVPVASAEGKSFFKEIAPCTNNRLVRGRFQEGIEKGEMDFELKYTFTYKMKPTNVKIRAVKDPVSKSNWIFVGT
jgi:photoactive yellow protein